QAGIAYYRMGAANWKGVQELIDATNAYITDKRVQLEANSNMPDTFASEFETLGRDFTDFVKNFREAELGREVAIGKKDLANERLYEKFASVMNDGQTIFSTKDD